MADGWTAQAWDGQRLVAQLDGMTRDAAHREARRACEAGYTGRAIPPDFASADWTVYDPRRGVRTGPFDQVTLVRVPR